MKDIEFKCHCKCGHGVDDMHRSTMKKLKTAEADCPFDFKINSGMRCKAHNARVAGASKKSSHTKGYAVDIKVRNSWERFLVLRALIKAGFTRIGVAKTFIHADDDIDKPKEVLWTY